MSQSKWTPVFCGDPSGDEVWEDQTTARQADDLEDDRNRYKLLYGGTRGKRVFMSDKALAELDEVTFPPPYEGVEIFSHDPASRSHRRHTDLAFRFISPQRPTVCEPDTTRRRKPKPKPAVRKVPRLAGPRCDQFHDPSPGGQAFDDTSGMRCACSEPLPPGLEAEYIFLVDPLDGCRLAVYAEVTPPVDGATWTFLGIVNDDGQWVPRTDIVIRFTSDPGAAVGYLGVDSCGSTVSLEIPAVIDRIQVRCVPRKSLDVLFTIGMGQGQHRWRWEAGQWAKM